MTTTVEHIQLAIEHVDGASYVPALRDPNCSDYFDIGLRAKVFEAMKRYPDTGAEWYIGPEAVLGAIEEHLAALASL